MFCTKNKFSWFKNWGWWIRHWQVSADVSKLGDVVKNDAVKKTLNDELVEKVNKIDTSGFVLKTRYETHKSELEIKIPDVTDLIKTEKLTELEQKVPDVSGLTTKSAKTATENKTPDVSSLVKKTN